MVTKRQQLKWLAKRFESLPFDSDSILMSDEALGHMGNEYKITNQELKRERDKIQKKAEQVAQPAQDNSWYEREGWTHRGIPVELWIGGVFAYNCEVIVKRDNTYVLWNLDDDKPDCADYMNSQFRPLRTEREKAIDEMLLAIDHIKEGNFETFIGALYDAGYRKVKP